MLRYFILLTSLALVLTVVAGCDDRGTGIQPVELGELEGHVGIDPSPSHPFTPDLTLQLKNPQELLLGSAYWPPEAQDIPPSRPMPLLVLLAPEGGNRFYYFNAGLNILVRELTAAGEIQPMVIYCMSNDMTFGGYFYADSDPAGHYDTIFQYTPGDGNDDLLEYLHSHYPSTIELASKRGIGGVGQGAYGAFRAVIKNPGVYSSISVTDGPLDFDGSDNFSGLTSLFGDAMAEQHARYALEPERDSSGNPLPFDFKRDFDSSLTMPVSQMFIGGAFAFSPNDTLITYDRVVDTNYYYTEGRLDSVRTRGPYIENLVQYEIADSLLGGDSTTFIGGIVRGDSQSRRIDMDFHLPFDANGILYSPIWDRWMANNLEDMHEAAGGSPLADINMWFGTNQNAKWGYNDMTQSWIAYLQPMYSSIEVYEYSSFTDDPITSDEYLFDILREMLIFHSNNFGD